MSVYYKSLFKLMTNWYMEKKDLKELSGIGKSTMTRLKNCENTTMEVMDKICNVVQVTMVETVKIIKD